MGDARYGTNVCIYKYIYNYLYIQFYVIVYTPIFVKDICITHTQIHRQVSRRLFDFAGLTDSIGGAAKWCQDTVSQVWSQALHGKGAMENEMCWWIRG